MRNASNITHTMICAHNIQNKPMLLHHKRSPGHWIKWQSQCTKLFSMHFLCNSTYAERWKQIPNAQLEIDRRQTTSCLTSSSCKLSLILWFESITETRGFSILIYRRFLFIQFTEVTRGGHQTHDHIWEEPLLRLYKQTTHVDNPKIVEDKNSFLISCSVWCYTVMPCSENIPAICPGGLCEWLQLMCSERLKSFVPPTDAFPFHLSNGFMKSKFIRN